MKVAALILFCWPLTALVVQAEAPVTLKEPQENAARQPSRQVQMKNPSSLPDGRNGFSRWSVYPQDKGFFPIGVWLQKPALAGKYKALGVNFYYGLWQGPTADQVAELRRHGMGVICSFTDYAKSHLLEEPVIWGWMHGDEPDLAHHYPRSLLKGPGGKEIIKKHWPEIYAELDLDHNEYNGWGMGLHPLIDVQADYQEIKQHDRNRPVLLQLSKAVALKGQSRGRGDRNGKTWEYPLYIEGSDAVSYDIYPVAYGDADKLWQVPDGLDQLEEWGSGERPRMAIIECGFGESWATKPQQRAQVWMAVNHGAEGIAWFVHRWVEKNGKKTMYSDQMPIRHPEVGQAMQEINAELRTLAPVINAEIPSDVVRAEGVALDLGARRKDGTLYIFAVERGGKKGPADFRLKGVEHAQVEVIGEARSLNCRDGRFQDTFVPWGVHLYKVVPLP